MIARASYLRIALVILGLTLSGCEGGSAPAVEAFGTADAVDLVLDEDASPLGMAWIAGRSGPITLQQAPLDPPRARSLHELGGRAGYLNLFEAGEGNQNGGARSLVSWALVFEDNAAAGAGLELLRSKPDRTREDVRVRDARGFGEGAFVQRSRIENHRSIAYTWQVRNALVGLEARSRSGGPNEAAMGRIARRLVAENDRTEPTGGELALDPSPAPAATLLEQGFDDESSWASNAETGAGVPLTRHVDGALQVGIDGPGSRWEDTSSFGRQLSSLGDVVVEVHAEHVQGATARWGLMCRSVADAGFYVFVVGRDGYAAIHSSVGPSEPLELVASAGRTALVREAVDAGPHHLRVVCAGDPIAHLSLEANGVQVVAAYDDDPRAPGAIGMWIESQREPASVLYDDLIVSEVEGD